MDWQDKSVGMTRRKFVASSAMTLATGSLIRGAGAATWADQEASTLEVRREPSRVIIDTDPGVDDALALLLALRSPELKIEAITPVAGNVPLDLTLPNALRMVEISGREDIPVAAGAKSPLMRRLVTAAYAHGENGLGGAVFPEPRIKPVSEPASEFIGHIVRKYPHEVSLITLGPLTNVAAALQADDQLAGMIKGLIMMGGSLSGGNITPAAEFNIYVDPEAARIVFQSGIPLRMVGLDVTRKTSLTDEHVRRLQAAQSSVSQAAAKIARNAIDHTRAQGFMVGPNLHDSLAVAAFLNPSLIKWKKYYVDVETAGELTAGETLGYCPTAGDLQRKPEMEKQAAASMQIRGSAPTIGGTRTSPVLRDKFVPNVEVAVDVNSDKFFDLLIGRLTGNSREHS
ncbi:MAG: nucleoside hydrolase [Acidobacteriota bacterium]|nr:nucleoside hydrolase [Acidobacteriota bacterium]